MALRDLNCTPGERALSRLLSPKKNSVKRTALLPAGGLNDENLGLLGRPKRPAADAVAAAVTVVPAAVGKSSLKEEGLKNAPSSNSSSSSEAASSSPPPPVADIEYLRPEDLKPLDDPQEKMLTLLERLDGKDWLATCEALNHLRQLSLFHKDSLLASLEKAVPLVVKAMKNPRSALCKTSIMASADLFKAYQDQMLPLLDPLLLQLLMKASQDKRFVCEEAERTLEAMTEWLSPAPLLNKLKTYISNRSLRVRAKAAMYISRSVALLGWEGIMEFGLDELLRLAGSQLNDQLPESREAARKLVMNLYCAHRRHRQTLPLACINIGEEEKASNKEEEGVGGDVSPVDVVNGAWEEVCSRNLSPVVVQAILRLTSALS